MPSREPARDFYFSASEARGEYFATMHKSVQLICEYRDLRADRILWATEVTRPGQRPVSHSQDLMCVGRGVRAVFLGRVAGGTGDLWGALKEA